MYIPDFERIAQLGHAGSRCVEEVVTSGSYTYRLDGCDQIERQLDDKGTYPSLHCGVFIGQVTEIEVSWPFPVEGEAVCALGRVGSNEIP